jgi:hypothetical protein
VLEELEEKVIEVAAAEESEAAHSAAAEDAASRGDFDEASDEALLAEEAGDAAEEAEEELADAVARAKELASMSLAERLNPATLATAVTNYAPQMPKAATASVEMTRTAIRSRIDLVLGAWSPVRKTSVPPAAASHPPSPPFQETTPSSQPSWSG